MESLDKAAELSPNSALPHFQDSYLAAGILSEVNEHVRCQLAELNQYVLSELNKALSVDPNLQPALIDRAEVYFTLKQFRQAIPDYDKIIALDPHNAGACNDRGLAKMELGEPMTPYQILVRQ